MRIRLTGTAIECDAAAALIASVLDVVDAYTAYQHRPNYRLVLVYLDAQVPAEDRKEVSS